MEEQKNMNKKKLAGGITAGAGLLAVTAIGIGSIANWTDTGSVQSDFDAGNFGLELTVDDGQSWVAGEEAQEVMLDITTALSNELWGPGETDSTEFSVRIAPGSTHGGDMTFGFNEGGDFSDHYNWSITVADAGEADEETGDPTDLTLSSDEWAGHVETLESGEELDFVLDVEATDDLEQTASYSGEWTFVAEQLPNSR